MPRARDRVARDRATREATATDLAAFVRAAAARGIVRDALRATRDLACEDARAELRREILSRAKTSAPVASMSKADGAHALSEARRRLKELREMMAMVR